MGYSVIGSARDFDSRGTGSNPVTPVLLCGVKGKIIGRGKMVLKLKVWGMDSIPRQVTEICGCRQMEKARVYEARTLGSSPSSRVICAYSSVE